ncbi:MAG: hypothetical protein IJ113_01125 [Eggerthellaceae bacterium]|nr:hypothetical protein [Eggerthellaceae bacterium]
MGLFDKVRQIAADKIAPKHDASTVSAIQMYGNMELIGGTELRIKLTRDAECKKNIEAFLNAGIDYSSAALVDEGDRYACTVNGLVIGRCSRGDYADIKSFNHTSCSAVMRDYDGNKWSACSVYR